MRITRRDEKKTLDAVISIRSGRLSTATMATADETRFRRGEGESTAGCDTLTGLYRADIKARREEIGERIKLPVIAPRSLSSFLR